MRNFFQNRLLTEILRPKDIKEIILLSRIRRIFKNVDLNLQNLLFYGSAGIGKTSMAKILAKHYPTLYINVSADRGIDIVKDEIIEFCSTQSIVFNKNASTNLKIIILDELDGATDLFFKALRATIERFSNNVRFIATCNFLQKIPEPIQSRFLLINFNPEDINEEKELFELYKKRVKVICQKLNLNYESEEVLDYFIDYYFPDFRQILTKVQEFKNSNLNIISAGNIKKINESYIEIYNLVMDIKKTPIDNYTLIVRNYKNREDEIINAFLNDFPIWLKQNHPEKINKLPLLMIAIAEWDYRKTFMVDKLLGLLAMVYQCQQIIKN